MSSGHPSLETNGARQIQIDPLYRLVTNIACFYSRWWIIVVSHKTVLGKYILCSSSFDTERKDDVAVSWYICRHLPKDICLERLLSRLPSFQTR